MDMNVVSQGKQRGQYEGAHLLKMTHMLTRFT